MLSRALEMRERPEKRRKRRGRSKLGTGLIRKTSVSNIETGKVWIYRAEIRGQYCLAKLYCDTGILH